jgi:hypothetical protein
MTQISLPELKYETKILRRARKEEFTRGNAIEAVEAE